MDHRRRHRAVNGYCTVVGNDVFTHFRSTGPQSRPTFPGHLRAVGEAHTVNDAAPGFMRRMKLPGRALSRLMSHRRRRFADGDEWRPRPAEPGTDRMKGRPDPLGVATEGAVRGTVAGAGRIAGTVVTGDDAGQFNVGDARARPSGSTRKGRSANSGEATNSGAPGWTRCRAMSGIYTAISPTAGRRPATGAAGNCRRVSTGSSDAGRATQTSTARCGGCRKTGPNSRRCRTGRPRRSTPTARSGTFAPGPPGGKSLSEPAAGTGGSPATPAPGP